MSQIHQIYIIILWFLLQLLIEINCQISPIANRPPSSSYTTLIPSSGSSSSTESNTNILDNPVIITIFVFVGIFTLIFCLYLNSEIRKKISLLINMKKLEIIVIIPYKKQYNHPPQFYYLIMTQIEIEMKGMIIVLDKK
jgi:hypothetical protein